MRILGFQKHWEKLNRIEFTTFRVTRRDKDWQLGESVQIVIKSRSKNREPLGIAHIFKKESTCFRDITESEAIADGFSNAFEMWEWLKQTHVGIAMSTPLNKLTLRWIGRLNNAKG